MPVNSYSLIEMTRLCIQQMSTATFGRKMFWYAASICNNRELLPWPAKCVPKQNPISCCRSFHLRPAAFVKMFVETENVHAHSYLQNCELYSSTLMKPMDLNTDLDYGLTDILNQEWSSCRADGVFHAFKCISLLSEKFSLNLNDPKFGKLFSAVIEKCGECEDSQLFCLLQCLSLWPPAEKITSNQYYLLWSALDKVCLNRVKKWDVNENLLAVDHWARLKLVRSSEFVQSSVKKISRKVDRLSPQQFVQLMFYINLLRKLPISASKFEFEYAMETLLNKLTLEELAIASMGFFKSQTHLKSPQVSSGILSRLESSFKNGDPPPPDSIMLASLLKLLRAGVHPTLATKLHSTLDAMLPHLKNLSLLCCLHVALIGSNIQLIHEEVIDSVCNQFIAEMKKCRLKDIERLAFMLTLFSYNPKTNPTIYEVMVAEIRERVAERGMDGTKWEELDKYGECLLRFLSYLSFQQIYPLDLIEKAMDQDFILKSYGNNRKYIGREVFMLDVCMEILFPGQMKYRLSPELRGMLSRKFLSKSSKFTEGKKLSAGDRLLVDVLDNIRSLSGHADRVSLHHVLPQFTRPDIVFCIGENDAFYDKALPKYNHNIVQSCPVDSGIWCAVVTGSRNNFIKPTNQLAGPMVHRMLLLKKLGFRPIMVPCFEWETLRNSDKRRYLKEKIFNLEE